jgi:hypothetical protein
MEMKQMMEGLMAKIDVRMDANTKAMQEKADENLKGLKEDIKTNQLPIQTSSLATDTRDNIIPPSTSRSPKALTLSNVPTNIL